MVQDKPVVQEQSEARPRSVAGRSALFGGVAGACVLGAGLGLWARPSDLERPAAAAAKPAVAATPVSTDRRIPIVVEDSPAPIGKPMDVLSASPPRPAVIPRHTIPARPSPPPELLAPTRPPNGLVRVAAPGPGPIARPAASRVAQVQALQAEAHQAQVLQAHALQAQAARRRAEAARLQAARVERAEKARERAQFAAREKAEAKAERLDNQRARHERVLEAKAKARAHAIQLAKAAPPPPKPRRGLAILTHVLAQLAPHHATPAVERAEARPERRRKPAEHETRLAKAPARPRLLAPAQPLVARGAGPIRVANLTTRCASSDPGEALACGDPNLGAAERRMTRAYRDAEAAGVPASTLQQQQARWKSARAAAAREAPWAVREVYQARIAELQDLVRDAQGSGRGN